MPVFIGVVLALCPIEPFVPMMMFAIVFGLSMDYDLEEIPTELEPV